MTLYMDVHRNQTEATPEGVRKAHLNDLEAQEKYGVRFLKYWFNPSEKTVCCLVDAPSPEAAAACHREAHGNVHDEIIEVESGMVEAFLGGGGTDDVGCALNRDGKLDSAFRTILFTDLVGSTSMTQQRGDEGAMATLRAHDALVRGALAATGGHEVKHTGDGIMASFVTASDAIQCALAVQKGVAAHNKANPDDRFEVRIGLSAGEPVSENRDLFGAAVQMAARVCNEAGAGEILVANVVRELSVGKSVTFEDRGTRQLKGFPEPVRIFAVVAGGRC